MAYIVMAYVQQVLLADWDFTHGSVLQRDGELQSYRSIFVAPELADGGGGGGATAQADMFSFGRTVAEVLGEEALTQMPALLDLVQSCMRADAETRPTATEALAAGWEAADVLRDELDHATTALDRHPPSWSFRDREWSRLVDSNAPSNVRSNAPSNVRSNVPSNVPSKVPVIGAEASKSAAVGKGTQEAVAGMPAVLTVKCKTLKGKQVWLPNATIAHRMLRRMLSPLFHRTFYRTFYGAFHRTFYRRFHRTLYRCGCRTWRSS